MRRLLYAVTLALVLLAVDQELSGAAAGAAGVTPDVMVRYSDGTSYDIHTSTDAGRGQQQGGVPRHRAAVSQAKFNHLGRPPFPLSCDGQLGP